jgi:glycosyltransferase involved in cell wall biosynthesis
MGSMSPPLRVLHLTPHLGGGVGKAISCLTAQACASGAQQHTVVSLETPEKPHAAIAISRCGARLLVAPSRTALERAVAEADIVQVEFWNHPATLKALCEAALPPMRLVVWCHISGVHDPIIPSGLMRGAHRVLFTSACSLDTPEVCRLDPDTRAKLDVISSGCGLHGLPSPRRNPGERSARIGYLGSLNFAKLHPEFVALLSPAARHVPDLRVHMIGETVNRETLESQCNAIGRPNLLAFHGFRSNVAAELSELDILIYLLNPRHYGTAENALLESMAMGVVPIVLDNPAERLIVEHGVTGFVARDANEVADALQRLLDDPELRSTMARRAAMHVRGNYQDARMAAAFDVHYRATMSQQKRAIDFRSLFGVKPSEWFQSFQRGDSVFTADGAVAHVDPQRRHTLLERTKGSVFHFLANFPEDPLLRAWSAALKAQEP